jgi:DNA end-binding protein Ku
MNYRENAMATKKTAKHVEAEENDDNDNESKSGSRAIWSGSISFGLLDIPVRLLAAEVRTEEIHFHQVDKHDQSPIRYERVNAKTGKRVEYRDIEKAFEYKKGQFVVLESGDLAKANVKATQTIDIEDFVPRDQIDPFYFETPYWVAPSGKTGKAYALLCAALAKKNAVAIGTFVMRTRAHLVALMPVDDGILLETLRFGHEVKSAAKAGLTKASTRGDCKFAPREIAMAEELVEKMTADFDPTKYKDRFHDDVLKIAAEKAKTGEVTARNVPKERASNVIDLSDLLQKSLAASSSHSSKTKKTGGRKSAA